MNSADTRKNTGALPAGIIVSQKGTNPHSSTKEARMAKGQMRSNKEKKNINYNSIQLYQKNKFY